MRAANRVRCSAALASRSCKSTLPCLSQATGTTVMGEVKTERLPVKLESLLEDIHRQASLLGQERNVQVVLGLVMPAVVLGDELRLRELFLNLVDNAVKYSRPGGTVDISLVTQGNQAKFIIADQGIGISCEDQQRIFDRFYRTDDARSHTKKGTGLGLAICAWIADSHHAAIDERPYDVSFPHKDAGIEGQRNGAAI